MENTINLIMSIFEVSSNFLSNIPEWLTTLITALIGAIVGGKYTLRGVEKEAEINKRAGERDSLELQLSVLKGIKGEISILFDLYNRRMRKTIDEIKPGSYLNISFPIGDDNFTFYEQNANVIAKLSNNTRDSIISIYTHSRSLIQSFKGNNKLLDQLEEIVIIMYQYKDEQRFINAYKYKIKVLIENSQGLKRIDSETSLAINEGLVVINDEINRITDLLK